ncbi:DivIVA domain-containing protein [Planosporangium sp. 12N6]|uniref:DivIVA domain-containing protein n=1 Tax=Planosporangium spinosum TaxID=3402278 RepID=UPI003CF11FD3
MTSQGQRFRRRALRRGYKVDEVDAFLDRVEATLAGNAGDTPVAAQEVHDVVFRVRFGGYDEWQVDLHLDRVERQLAEFEERNAAPYGREQRPPAPERMAPPPMAPPPVRDDRMMAPPVAPPSMAPPMAQPPLPPRPVSPVPTPPAPTGYDRYDEPTRFSGFDTGGFEPGRHGKSDMTTEIRMPDSGFDQPYPPVGPPSPSMPPEVARIDQLRRTFQLRRFGSGYDRVQVDRLFETVVDALSGRSGTPLSEAELDPAQFSLVPGGYFEAEVDAALKEVRDILARRR